MDIADLPEWFIDVQRVKQDMLYGRIPLELIVSGNQITKVIGTKANQVKFRNNEEAKIYTLDQLNSLQGSGTKTFSVAFKNGAVTQVNTFDQLEYNYPS